MHLQVFYAGSHSWISLQTLTKCGISSNPRSNKNTIHLSNHIQHLITRIERLQCLRVKLRMQNLTFDERPMALFVIQEWVLEAYVQKLSVVTKGRFDITYLSCQHCI